MAFKLFGKNSNYSADYKKFKKAMSANPGDYILKAQFIKFCLLNRFTKHETIKDHITEALGMFENIARAESFDLQCHYLVGKYYQEDRDTRKAYQVYLYAIQRFNDYVVENPDLKSENTELAYSIALNLMTLQLNPVDPEVERCFKIIRKSFPLHLKRIELEHEMAKPAPEKAKIKQLGEAIRKLKAQEEEKEKENPAPAPAEEKITAPEEAKAPEPKPKPKDGKGINSKLFRDLSLDPMGFAELTKKVDLRPDLMPEKPGYMDSFQLSPLPDSQAHGPAFMVYHEEHNHWEGPYSPDQLRNMGFLKPASWVCRAGSDQVIQAYESPDLQVLFQGDPA